MSCGNCGCDNCGGTCVGNGGCVNPCPYPNMVRANNEPLSSALDNFVSSFFGTVTKTVVNGQVVWALPCNLDIGLPSNPRQQGEGLACYFLRLFLSGIIGLVGPQGPAGPAGVDGQPAWSFTLSAFVHPAVGLPITIPLSLVTWCTAGAWVLIQGSGYYQIALVASNAIVAQLVSELPGHLVVIPASSLVVGSGPPGATGAQGIPGVSGGGGAVNMIVDRGTKTGDVLNPTDTCIWYWSIVKPPGKTWGLGRVFFQDLLVSSGAGAAQGISTFKVKAGAAPGLGLDVELYPAGTAWAGNDLVDYESAAHADDVLSVAVQFEGTLASFSGDNPLLVNLYARQGNPPGGGPVDTPANRKAYLVVYYF